MAEEKKNGKWQGVLFAALLILVAVFFIVRKNKKLAREHEFYAYYQNIKGLQSSSPVQINGVRIGKISDIDLNGNGKVRVTIRIKKEIKIADGTVALLASGNILGDKLIKLIPGKGPGFLTDLSTIPAAYDTSVMKVSVQIAPYLETAKLLLSSTDTSLKSFNILFQTHLLTKIVTGFASTEETFNKYALTTAKWEKKGEQVARKMERIDSTLSGYAAGSNNLQHSLGNVESKTANIAGKDLNKNVQDLKASVSKLKATFSKYNSSDSGFGRLINNKQAYTDMSNNFDTLNRNMQESYHHPKGFSIFGGKKKKK